MRSAIEDIKNLEGYFEKGEIILLWSLYVTWNMKRGLLRILMTLRYATK